MIVIKFSWHFDYILETGKGRVRLFHYVFDDKKTKNEALMNVG
jgi:hypothetical protein